MPARFSPALGHTTVLPLIPNRDPGNDSLYFTYTPPDAFPQDKLPEVWTNLPLASGALTGAGAAPGAPAWHAVRFGPSPSAHGVFVAPVPLALDGTGEAGGSFEYTFRLRTEGGAPDDVEWLGSEGSNGRIEVVAVSNEALARAQHGPRAAEGEGWTALADGVKVWEGNVDGDKAKFDLTWLVNDEQWSDAEAVVWEQSVRTWFQPRLLPRIAPLAAISPSVPAQLLVLRSSPTRAHPLPQTLVLLPFSTRDACSALYGDGNGGLQLRAERDASEGEVKAHLALAYSSGAPGAPALTALLANVGAAARAVASGAAYTAPPALPSTATGRLNEPKGLGLCTWNALSSEGAYTASAVLAWLDALLDPAAADALVPAAAKTVLLDDGWQDVASFVDFDARDAAHGERLALRSFQCDLRDWYDLEPRSALDEQADAERARRARAQQAKKLSLDSGYAGSPVVRRRSLALVEEEETPREGVCVELRDVVRRIKERGVEKVGVWLTLAGYWHGVHPDSSLADAYTLRRVELRSATHPAYSGHVFLPTVADLPQFYLDYFSSLAAAGVDFVKVDDQALVDAIVAQEVGDDEEPGAVPDAPGALRTAMLASMHAAALDVFGPGAVTHCMAGSPRIWAGALLGTTDTVRTSDDYAPGERDAHRWHVAHNAFVALLASQALGLECDFDMAQGAASCEFAGAHLPLRAFSTAQLLATDPAPATDAAAGWDTLLATTKGGVRILQARTPGVAGATLASSLGDDVLGRLGAPGVLPGATESRWHPLKVGLPVPAAHGAHMGVWDCAPLAGDSGAAGGRDRETRAVLDEKDVADVLGGLVSSEVTDAKRDFVLFAPSPAPAQDAAAVEVDLADVRRAANAPRPLARPLLSVVVAPAKAQVVTLAELFPLTAANGAEGIVKVACLGLAGKTVGLAAMRAVRIGAGDAPAPPSSQTAVGRAQSLLGAVVESVTGSSSSRSTPSSSALSSGRASPAPQLQAHGAALPPPQGRLPFILAYFASAFRRTPASPGSGSGSGSGSGRTPRSEIRSLAQDLVAAPLRTVVAELRALVSFSLAAILWAVQGARAHHANDRTVEADAAQTVATPGVTVPVGEPLRIELDYLGTLALYLSSSRPLHSSGAAVGDGLPPLRITLDAHLLEDEYVRTTPLSGGADAAHLVELDLEGAWNKRVGPRTARREVEGAAEEEDLDISPWVVEVQALGAEVAA
ncbi:hypothetical protein JCM3770_004268 [Rhodotorula araucariae]